MITTSLDKNFEENKSIYPFLKRILFYAIKKEPLFFPASTHRTPMVAVV